MKLSGNTVFITGGTSGIGRSLAEALHKRGNQVIISGRRKGHLAEVTRANPGMQSLELNVEDPASIAAVAKKLIAEYPKLNVLINNAGIMQIDDAAGAIDDSVLVSIVTTNLLGPIRMTSALIEHLKKQPSATVINVSSGLAFVPLASTAVYSATKAAIHSYTQSMRYRLKGSSVRVLELIPPWVQTDLLNSKDEPRAMPLAAFIEEAVTVLGTDAEEVMVERVKMLRNNPVERQSAVRLQCAEFRAKSKITPHSEWMEVAMRVARKMSQFFGIALLLLTCGGLSAQTKDNRVKNIVLVHGAWADGSGWRGVYDILVKDGYNVSMFKSRRPRLQKMSRLRSAFLRYKMGRPFLSRTAMAVP
jgi:uncharacterized oxidoreductase